MRKVKVCHMTSAHSATDVRIFHKQCTSLAKAGYETYLVAPGDSFIENGVQVIGVGLKPASRIKRMFFFAKQVYKKAKEVDADIYHLHDPELLPYGHKLKKLGKKVIYDIHEHYVQTIRAKVWLPKPLRAISAMVYARKEKNACKRFDAIIYVTPTQLELIKPYDANAYMVTNFPIVDAQAQLPVRSENRKLCFAGGILPRGLHENLISMLEECDAQYELAGGGSLEYLNKLKLLQGWQKVNFRGKTSFQEAQILMQKSAVGVAILDYDANNMWRTGTLGVTKIFEYMLNGLPLICTDFVLWKKIVDTEQCGICVNPHDKDAIKKAILHLLDNPKEATQMGANGFKAVMEKYNWGTQEAILFKVYENL